ncbi:MAG: tRNA preQ1(34) S-adenosylmethionine ribosyltransferase-isomerase QueA [Vicinamibacteria bacterium]|nr:tRNA preQ1(34) S-adenosylmethionine ribosyltransferase-isomerase QueA [Vicinamibacteria bacterium]
MKTEEFDFDLPPDRIAQVPLPERDASRLLVLNRANANIEHSRFCALPGFLQTGDLLVVNRSRVVPARLLGTTRGGGRAEVFYLFPEPTDPTTFRAFVRPGRKLPIGAVVRLGGPDSCTVVAVHPDGARTMRFEGHSNLLETVQRLGHLPLPPYIDRAAGPLDQDRYQTVFAKEPGSVAAPTAGLHFTEALLARLRDKGVLIHEIMLHVGPGTFARVHAANIDEHRVPPEAFFVPDETAKAYAATKAGGHRVIAVGTTTVRTLESVAQPGGIKAGAGETNLMIRPGHRFQTIDAMITNFHLPKSSLLFLVSAFAGREAVLHAYGVAISEGYRFYSYGDAMFIHGSPPTEG